MLTAYTLRPLSTFIQFSFQIVLLLSPISHSDVRASAAMPQTFSRLSSVLAPLSTSEPVAEKLTGMLSCTLTRQDMHRIQRREVVEKTRQEGALAPRPCFIQFSIRVKQ